MKMNFSKRFNSGFTLIELLVVVAIIGILASVVLASLNTARAKGANAAIKANLSNIRAAAEIIYDGSGHYGSDFCTSAKVAEATDAAAKALGAGVNVNNSLGTGGSATTVNCHVASGASPQSWAIASGLKPGDAAGAIWCVDSTGASKGQSSFGANWTSCNS